MKTHSFWGEWWPSNIPSERWTSRRILRIQLGYWKELGKWPVPGRIFRWSGLIPDIWYYIKCKLWRRYNRVIIPTLPPTWIEWDERLLHVNMTVFVDFMDSAAESRWNVCSLHNLMADPNEDEMSRNWAESALPDAKEQEAIYAWWKFGRAARLLKEDQALEVWHNVFQAAGGVTFGPVEQQTSQMIFAKSAEADELHAIYQELEKAGEQEDEDMLIRLIKIRQSLWT